MDRNWLTDEPLFDNPKIKLILACKCEAKCNGNFAVLQVEERVGQNPGIPTAYHRYASTKVARISFGQVAQLEERWCEVPQVVGSSPTLSIGLKPTHCKSMTTGQTEPWRILRQTLN